MYQYQAPRKLLQQSAAQWPVTLKLVKQHCRIEFDNDDEYLNHLITVAVDYIESGADITLPITRYKYQLDTWPAACRLTLPLKPVRQLTGVSYTNTEGVLTPLLNSDLDFRLLGVDGGIYLNPPMPSDAAPYQPLMIDYTAGYGSIDVTDDSDADHEYPFEFGEPIVLSTDILDWPKIAIQAALIGVQHFYENREAVVVGTITSEMPITFNACIERLRVRGL